ncbi:hypothetical protein BP422_13315 [Brevibacillus formosus]|uniref:Site-specific DNA-methyltransferase (cytosine-N(4)-specific) n=1 Tax=Brevibacillus formosus TaxID=54913 RepID=A0A220MHB8_9BACL|nr:DNA adenine methylase [Brevibacillus formosus]ASJ54448.1 hypothetical protein BP422_13315 [Brevibacillus formosus]
MKQSSISKNSKIWQEDLNYSGANNFSSFFSSNSNLHTYPAKAVPNMIKSLLETLKNHYNVTKVLDPFTGSGTVALEAKVLGLDFCGSDLNPLAVLLARTKVLSIENTSATIDDLYTFLKHIRSPDIYEPYYNIEKFERINFWFKEKNIEELSFIKHKIKIFLRKQNNLFVETYALILFTAFSSTIRAVSLTRNNEFKLYRMSPSDIKKHNVDAFEIFEKNAKNLLQMLKEANESFLNNSTAEIHLENAKKLGYIGKRKVNAVLTSPPYGDSKSTVAYGQFSKLSLQWLENILAEFLSINIQEVNVDELLLGGKKSTLNINTEKEFLINHSKTLSELLLKIEKRVKKQEKKYNNILEQIKVLEKCIQQGGRISKEKISNRHLLELINERLRLEIVRKINKLGDGKSKSQINILAKKQAEGLISHLDSTNGKKRFRANIAVKAAIPFVKETVRRKLKSQPKRATEVVNFFKDLFLVVKRTDEILDKKGIQAWIVGHRTVLGNIKVNMQDILKDWFESLGYTEITKLQRKYSFKRLPHHINSTVTRKSKIKTMMTEHILVMQKNK